MNYDQALANMQICLDEYEGTCERKMLRRWQAGAAQWATIALALHDTKQKTAAEAIGEFISAGFTPGSAVQAVTHDDLGRLEHTGLVSVQLTPLPETAVADA